VVAPKFSEKAEDYLIAPPARLNILHGSVRSGKTTNTILVAPERFAKAPKGDIIITGKTERTAYRNVVRPMQEMFGARRVKFLKGTGEGKLGNRTFYLIGASNEAAENKIRGLTVAYWLGDEVSLYPESFTAQGLARMSPEGACTDWSMNPGPPRHYIKVNYIDRERELDARAWHFLLEHNPNLSRSYVENLKKEYGEGSLFYKRYIDGLWVLAEGSVYDFFREDGEGSQVIDAPPCEPDFYTVSADYGTGNATVFGLFGHLKKPRPDGLKVWLECEYYWDSRSANSYQKTDAEYVEDLGEWLGDVKPREVIVDPSAASFKVALERKGYKVTDADNDVVNGIRTQATMLKSGAYRICRAARQTIQDYNAYVWDARAQERGEDRPLKKDDHTKDCERYDLHTLYGTPPKERKHTWR
jgi:PBSX family phage terminase large subunit